MGEFSPWHILIVAIAFMVLFGYKRLPAAAKSVGQSMKIFKDETKGLRNDDHRATSPAKTASQQAAAVPAPQLAAPAAPPVAAPPVVVPAVSDPAPATVHVPQVGAAERATTAQLGGSSSSAQHSVPATPPSA